MREKRFTERNTQKTNNNNKKKHTLASISVILRTHTLKKKDKPFLHMLFYEQCIKSLEKEERRKEKKNTRAIN